MGVALIVQLIHQSGIANAMTATTLEDYENEIATYSIDESVLGYREYTAQFQNIHPAESYVLDAEDYVRFTDGTTDENGNEIECQPEIYTDYEGSEGNALLTYESGLIEYEVNIETEGFYEISVLYYPVEGKNSNIQRSFFIDGELPFSELASIEFPRIWGNNITDFTTDENGIRHTSWEVDNQGNDLKPSQIEIPQWVTGYLYDSQGYVTEALQVYFTAGTHDITMISLREPMLLRSITIANSDELLTYDETNAAADSVSQNTAEDQMIRIEAENADRKSSQMLYPTQDQASSAVYPYSAKNLKNNTIGGNSWRLVGQWLEWDFTVEESGYYNISMFVKQNFMKGIYVSRKIMIDGEVPFEELSDYGFTYSQNWRMDTLSDEEGDAYAIYLEAGEHTLRMEAVLGEFSSIIADVQESLTQLNAIYRKVIRITGVAPDTWRDYQLEATLPELEGELIEVHDLLDSAITRLRAAAGSKSDKETVLITMRDQLESLIEDQELFVKVLANYKINVRACGTWINTVLSQPLQMDTIYIYSTDVEEPVSGDTWWNRLVHEIKRLYYSFIIDYNQIGNVTEEGSDATTLTLWVGTGRDQANVIKALVDENFTKENDVNVNVMLVDMSTLLQATLAGQGPDVAIQVNYDLPMNYGLRNAVADLSQFDDLEEVKERFFESAMVAYEYNGATYALPETQTFLMMFYRKDILSELGIEVPKTWDDIKIALSVLNNNQMEIGMLPSEQVFTMFLYQNGGQYYNEDATLSALDSDEAINAFKTYCEYYTEYKLDKETSVEQRFRTGEAPIIIADYTVYNNFQVSAPDIKGLWGFAPVPGTALKDENGNYVYDENGDYIINNAIGSSGQACVLMEASDEKEAGWEFLKWWTSEDTQTLYGREMESLMGASARVATANIEAFSRLPWPVADYEALYSQFQEVKGIPQVPGGYFTWRNVNNAFYTVTTKVDTATPREELTNKIIYINDEINYKRIEFGLPLADE